MMFDELHNSAELMDLIDRIGFLPLLDSGIRGFSAEDIVAFDRIIKHLHSICPNATESQLIRMIK